MNRAPRSQTRRKAGTISRPHDPAERQADQAADVVARGGSVTGWSFGGAPLTAAVHREEKTGAASNDENAKKALEKTAEAALETKAGKDLQEKIKNLPEVKKAREALDTTGGKIVAGTAIAGGVAALAATGQPLPIQPKIPLDKIGLPGFSVQVKVEGPLNNPSYAGLVLSYQEQLPKSADKQKKAGGPTETERMAADQARFRESLKSGEQRRQEANEAQLVLAHVLAQGHQRLGLTPMLPLLPTDQPKVVESPPAPAVEAEEKKSDEAPLQREPASATETHVEFACDGVDDAIRGGGRPLDEATRLSMEARFGYDFSSVRLHSDAHAEQAAAGIGAHAFTVGEDIVLGHGAGDPRTPAGRHLLAHELTHVIQQRNADSSGLLQRRSAFEDLGILLGIEEGTWTDTELRAYLSVITDTGKIDGAYDADNKARAIVRKWKAGETGWDLLGAQKAVLIDEMIDGPTVGDDELCILDLLELSDAADLRVIFTDPAKRVVDLEDNIDDENRTRLDAFVAAKFKGGRAELIAGRVEVLGAPAPAGAPSFAFDVGTFDARLDSEATSDDLIALIDRFSAEDRAKAIEHLLHRVWPKLRDEVGVVYADDSATSQAEQDVLNEQIIKLAGRQHKVERILSHYFIDEVGPSADALKSTTKAQDSSRYQELRDVLSPRHYSAPEPDSAAADTKDAEDGKDTKDSSTDPGGKRKFHDKAQYAKSAEAAVRSIVDTDYRVKVVEATGTRATKGEIEPVADLAKVETDRVFGAYYEVDKKPALHFNQEASKGQPGKPGKLDFWFEKRKRDYGLMGPEGRRAEAREKIRYYYVSTDEFRLLNDQHGADPQFTANGQPINEEAKILNEIAVRLTKVSDAATKVGDDDSKNINMVTKLLRIDRNWGGAQQGGRVYVDLVHQTDVADDQRAQWDLFQTLIHEYLHLLTNSGYETYAKSFGYNSTGWNTLMEGMCSVFTDVVWASVAPRSKDPALRLIVEGPANSKQPPVDIGTPAPYPSYTEARSLVELAGIKNAYAAFFLGLVDRISAPKPKPGKPAPAKPTGGKP